ncbi:hypothetical protein CIK99_09795 [Prevotella sp. P5-92]|nr:hypothetical protein CIK99_09795 [Prevotella sp. P5-92]
MTTLILSVFFSISASADVVEVDGIYYDISETTATVTYGDNEYSGDIVIPESITYENSKYSVTSIGDWAFSYCTGLTSITIPNSVTSIGNYAFWDCYGLTSITIPNSVTSIGDYAFYDCCSLTSITIPNSVTSIGDGAFSGCLGLTSITIPNSVTSIGELAFDECSGLTSITIPNSVTSIGDYVLNLCDGIKNTIIVNDMFVYLPKTYTGHYSIPENITKIIGGAFSECSGLTSVTIPNSVTSIGSSAFAYCSSLTSVTIPNSVTSIGDWAFSECSGLTSVTIPNSVTSIGDWAFDCCDNLKNVYCYSEEVPSTNVWIFDGTYIENATLHVPASAINAYKTTKPWSGFGTIKAIEGTVGVESVKDRGIAIQSAGGFINISGLDNNEKVSFYGIDGKALGSATAINGTTSFAAQSGSIVVAKIGKENIKIAVK